MDLEEINKEYEKKIPKLTDEQCKEGIITKEEVLFTLRRMKNWTSPGSDVVVVVDLINVGFTEVVPTRIRRVHCRFLYFFLKWPWFFPCARYACDFQKRKLYSPQKEGILTLLPKGDKPRQFLKTIGDPSLCPTVSYKIALGCIANIIQRVIYQTLFIVIKHDLLTDSALEYYRI